MSEVKRVDKLPEILMTDAEVPAESEKEPQKTGVSELLAFVNGDEPEDSEGVSDDSAVSDDQKSQKPQKKRQQPKRVRQPREANADAMWNDVKQLIRDPEEVKQSHKHTYFFNMPETSREHLTLVAKFNNESTDVQALATMVDKMYQAASVHPDFRLTPKNDKYIQPYVLVDSTYVERKRYIFELEVNVRGKIHELKEYYGFNTDADFIADMIDKAYELIQRKYPETFNQLRHELR